MVVKKISECFPAELKTLDGINTGKSINVIIHTEFKSGAFGGSKRLMTISHFDFKKSIWITEFPLLTVEFKNIIGWSDMIPILPLSNFPSDDEPVKFKNLQGQEFIGTYFENEDMFVLNDGEFYFSQFVQSWEAIK